MKLHNKQINNKINKQINNKQLHTNNKIVNSVY